MATPPAASSAAREVVSTPSRLTEVMTIATVRTKETKEVMKDASVGSVLRLSKRRLSSFLIRPMIQMPTR